MRSRHRILVVVVTAVALATTSLATGTAQAVDATAACTVTATADSGAGTWRQAVADASAGLCTVSGQQVIDFGTLAGAATHARRHHDEHACGSSTSGPWPEPRP